MSRENGELTAVHFMIINVESHWDIKCVFNVHIRILCLY
jgi:hypothetical protein